MQGTVESLRLEEMLKRFKRKKDHYYHPHDQNAVTMFPSIFSCAQDTDTYE